MPETGIQERAAFRPSGLLLAALGVLLLIAGGLTALAGGGGAA